MKTVTFILSMFLLVSCETVNIKGIVIAKSFSRDRNDVEPVDGTYIEDKSNKKYFLHINRENPIPVKEYFWKLAKCGDSIFVYRKTIKLKKHQIK